MKNYLFKPFLFLIALLSLTIVGWKSVENKNIKKPAIAADSLYKSYVNELYSELNLQQHQLSLTAFAKAVTGFINVKKSLNLCDKDILTIVNFDQLSTEKRLYIIDLSKKKLLLTTWVAHGEKSGHNTTQYFSNLNNSYASSLGFYLTGEIYYGSHGKSLKLDGLDEGFNDNARKRDIVVHGAPYVSKTTMNKLGRLGRSLGCPAVAPEIIDEVIDAIANKTILFVNKSNAYYSSKYLDEHFAAQKIATEWSAAD